MQIIAPNNTLPATHFIEVYGNKVKQFQSHTPFDIRNFSLHINSTKFRQHLYTIAIFRIRENKLPTLHNFNK